MTNIHKYLIEIDSELAPDPLRAKMYSNLMFDILKVWRIKVTEVDTN